MMSLVLVFSFVCVEFFVWCQRLELVFNLVSVLSFVLGFSLVLVLSFGSFFLFGVGTEFLFSK